MVEKELKIRDICDYYALDIPNYNGSNFTTELLLFNSKKNAETVKHIIEVDKSKLNTATVCEMEEVKHGKWEKEDTIMGTYIRCSVCHFDKVYADFQYCPYCGAKMDKE